MIGGDFFFLRGHDAFQRGVANLVDARLNGEHRGQRAFDVLKPAGFEFALELHSRSLHFDLHDDGGVRQVEQFGEQHAGLAESVIVALQAGQNQIEIFFLERGGQERGGAERIELRKIGRRRCECRDRRPSPGLP